MTAIKIDRPAIFRDAWSRARAAAVAASEKVGQHIGAALRAAWASARIAPQPVQQQQASAAPVEAISITATEAERLEAKCSALREQKEAAFALLRECREERIAAVAGETDACPGVCWTNEERAEAAADEATDALDRCLADYWEACDYLRDEEREERRTSLKARIAQGPAMVLQPVQQQQACAAPVAYAYSSVKPTRYTDTHVLLHGADPAPILERRLDGRVIVAASGTRNRWIIVDQAAPSKALIKAAGKKARVADERLVVATDDLPEVLSVVDGFLAGCGEERAAAKAARAKATASAKAAAMAAAKAEADRVAAAQARAEDEVRRAAAHRAHIDAERAAKPALDAACAAITSGVVSYRGGMYAAGILVVRTPYDSRIVAALRTVPGATWSEASRVWTVPARSHGALAPLVADLNTWAAEASAALAAAVRAEDEARTAKARELAGRRYIELAARAPQPGSLVKIGDRMVIVESLGRVFRAPEDDGLLDPWMEGEPVQYVYHRPATADEISGARGK